MWNQPSFSKEGYDYKLKKNLYYLNHTPRQCGLEVWVLIGCKVVRRPIHTIVYMLKSSCNVFIILLFYLDDMIVGHIFYFQILLIGSIQHDITGIGFTYFKQQSKKVDGD